MNLNVIRRRLAGTPRVLAQSGVAVSHTGNITETTLASITIPGGMIGANGQVEVITLWTLPNSANNKTCQVKLGGSTMMSAVLTTALTFQPYCRIANRGSAASQIANPPMSTNAGFGSTDTAVSTATIDTTQDTTITITGQLASAAETMTLESYIVQVFPKA